MAKLLLLLFSFVTLFQLSLQQAPECSATQLCPIGCCSKAGFCGTGPDFCGKDKGCLSTCDFKADCNPGWDSPNWSKAETCPLNVCCSKFGFCGTTKDFCGDTTVKRPSCGVNDTPITRVIGYYESWSTEKRSCLNMLPEEIPYGYYTDIIFSFATIDPSTFEIKAGNAQTATYMERISAIKLIQPDIKIWIAVGGWAFNDPGPTQSTFSDIAASSSATKKFIDSLIEMMNKYGFDGIDIDWEYPVDELRFGKGADFKNFVTFMEALAKRMRGGDLKKAVSLTLPASYYYLQHFDIKNLQKHVDWFNVMTYDMHGSWDIDNEWTGPYANSHSNMTEIQSALDLLWRNDVKPDKVTFGMAFYSRTFTLQNAGCNTPGCVVASGGTPGKCSDTTGVLLHPEIADVVSQNKLTPTLHRDAAVKSVSWGDQWTTFDDLATWRLKSNIIRGQCIPGVMVWAMSQDDKDATNIKALTSAIGRKQMAVPKFEAQPVEQPPPKVDELCRWSGCYRDCPAGFKTVQRNGHKEIMLNGENCLGGGSDKLCCPSDQDMPVCEWRGHRDSGVCKPGCKDGEVTVGSLRVGCNFSHQTACCTTTSSTAAYGQCKWVGTSPTCASDCPSDYPNNIFSSDTGAGGEQPCITGTKHFCCQQPTPAPFTNCDWFKKEAPAMFENAAICEDSCPAGRVKLATQVANFDGCFGGARAYCCEAVKMLDLTPRDDDPFGGKQNKEFQMLLEKYMENPTCPATILHPPIGNMFTDPYPVEKRSLDLEAAQSRALQGRAVDCQMDNFERMMRYATLLLTVGSQMLQPLQVVWDELFAGSYHTALEAENLRTYYQRFNGELDPDSLMRYVVMNPLTAGDGLERDEQTREIFCEYPSLSKREEKASLSLQEARTPAKSSTTLSKRYVYWLQSLRNGIPEMSTILAGILNGDLSLHYARWQYVANQGGPMLELAYWIGRELGVPGDNNDYRDVVNAGTGRPDNWVVVHLHMNEEHLNWLGSFNGRTHVGIQSVRVFHSHLSDVLREGHAWRVVGTEQRNRRGGFECLEEGMWYPGARTAIPSGVGATDGTFYTRLQLWGERLFNEGYLGTPGLELILTGFSTMANGDIDLHNAGQIVPWTHPGFNQNLWNVNWVIRNGVPYFGIGEPNLNP